MKRLQTSDSQTQAARRGNINGADTHTRTRAHTHAHTHTHTHTHSLTGREGHARSPTIVPCQRLKERESERERHTHTHTHTDTHRERHTQERQSERGQGLGQKSRCCKLNRSFNKCTGRCQEGPPLGQGPDVYRMAATFIQLKHSLKAKGGEFGCLQIISHQRQPESIRKYFYRDNFLLFGHLAEVFFLFFLSRVTWTRSTNEWIGSRGAVPTGRQTANNL